MKKPRVEHEKPLVKPRVKPRVKPAWLSQSHGSHGSGPSYAHMNVMNQCVHARLARMYICRGCRVLSGFKGLQHFWRGFTRGFLVFCRGFSDLSTKGA
jgi:hypothetical protein